MDDNLYFDTSTANLDTSIPSDQSRALPPDVKDQYIFNNYSSIGTLVGTMPINDNEDENNPNTTDYYLIYDSASSNRARVLDKVYLEPKEALYIRGELDTPNGYNFSDDAKLVKAIAYLK